MTFNLKKNGMYLQSFSTLHEARVFATVLVNSCALNDTLEIVSGDKVVWGPLINSYEYQVLSKPRGGWSGDH